MNGYSVSLFLHIVGALGFFISMALEAIQLWQLRPTTQGQVAAWLRAAAAVRRVGMISMLTLVASGIYMMATVWGPIVWILVSFGAIVLLILLATMLTGRRQGAVQRVMATEREVLSPTLDDLLYHPALWISIQMRLAIALGIVFLMTVKPALSGSLLTIGVTMFLGFVVSLATLPRNGRRKEPQPSGYPVS